MTYGEAVLDVRALAQSARTQIGDKAVARLLYRAYVRLLSKAAQVAPDDERLPIGQATTAVPADLGTTQIASITGTRLVRARVNLSDGAREKLNIVPAWARYNTVTPVPAAYKQDALLYAIPAQAGVPWTHAQIIANGWSRVVSTTVDVLTLASAPTALTATLGPHEVDEFDDVCVWDVVSQLTRAQGDVLEYHRRRDELIDSMANRPGETELVEEVW